MKVAALFSGHYRNFDKFFDLWKKNLIDRYNCDTFMCIWDNYGYRMDTNDTVPALGSKQKAAFDATKIPSHAKLQAKLNFTKLVIEDFASYDAFFKREAEPIYRELAIRNEERRVQWLYSQWYKRKQVMAMANAYAAANNIQYDWVFLSRPDFRLDAPPLFEEDDPQFLHMCQLDPNIGYHDFYAYSSHANMMKYCSLYDYINTGLLQYFFATDFMNILCGHHVLRGYTEQVRNDLKIKITSLLGYIER